jgi:elongation factor G
MTVVISTDEATMGAVMQDVMSARNGHILSIDGDSQVESIESLNQRPDAKPIDLRKVYAPKDPFAPTTDGAEIANLQTVNCQRSIVAKIPLREMVGYLKHLRSITAGRGTFIMSVDRFEKMNTSLMRSVLKELRGV